MYKISLWGGETIVKAATLAAARQWGLIEFGRDRFKYAAPATEDEIDWVKAMGGAIHEA